MGWLMTFLRGLGSVGTIGRTLGAAFSNPLVLVTVAVVVVFWLYSEKLDAEYSVKQSASNIQLLEDTLKDTRKAFKLLALDTERVYKDRFKLEKDLERLPKTKAEVLKFYGLDNLTIKIESAPDATVLEIDAATGKLFGNIEESLNGRTHSN